MIELIITQNIITKHEQFIFGEKNVKRAGRINCKLKTALVNEVTEEGKILIQYIIDELKAIVLSKIEKLFEIKDVYVALMENIPDEKERNRIHLILKKMFEEEYTSFYSDPVFNAYEFQRMLDVNICPYCGTQFIFLYESESGKSRGTLDHFIDKAKYPIFAVSIYNLVPCCKVCNSDFKNVNKMDLTNYYTPYEKGIVEHIRFKKRLLTHGNGKILPEVIESLNLENQNEIDYVSSILGINDHFNIDIDCSSASEFIFKKIQGNIELFKIKELYNLYHKNYVRESIRKAYVYNYVYRKQLMSTFSDLFVTEEEVKRLVIPNVEEDNKYILNKLIRDIVIFETKNFSI